MSHLAADTVRNRPDRGFEQFLEFAPDATVGVERDGRIVLLNAQTEALFGYTRTELLGQQVEILIPERFRGAHPMHRTGYFADPRTRSMGEGLELFAVRRDGTEFPAEISLSAIDEDGRTLAIAAIRDISERRVAERARAYLAAIVNSSDDAIIGKTLDGTIVSWNTGAERVYGYNAEEAIGQSVSILLPADRVGEDIALLRQVAANRGVDRYETVRKGKDGELLTMSLTMSPIREGDEIVGAATIARDVSREKAAQRKFEQLLEFAPDGILGVGRDGHVVFANAQTEAMFGYTRDELLGKPVELLIPERFARGHGRHRDGYFTDPRTRPMGAGLALFGRRRDGSEFPAEISLSSIESEDGVLATAAIRDISERVEAEREKDQLSAQLEESRRQDTIREKERLEAQLNQLRRLESVGQLAGGIAHDFNNLLAVILNYAQFVSDELDPDSPVRADVEEIRRAAERAAALTRQLLIFSRRDVVRPQVLDLSELIAQLDNLLRRALGEHVQLETRLARELPAVEADPGQLEQVLVNLAVNARDAMPTGGRLLIETGTVEFDETIGDVPPGTYVRLVVSDTGEGMDREVIDHAFEPFFSTKPRTEGTGLGLTTVYGIVTNAGGNIRIYSEPGLGTTVKVHLPASSAAVAAPPSQADTSPLPRGRGETVLLVEDEDSVRVIAERILQGAGYNVVAASRGDAALEVCRRADQSIDLLLTDVVMPEMLGPELVEQAIAVRPGLQVLYMSGYVHQAAAQLGLDEGITFVEKPFTAETLIGGVTEALGGQA